MNRITILTALGALVLMFALVLNRGTGHRSPANTQSTFRTALGGADTGNPARPDPAQPQRDRWRRATANSPSDPSHSSAPTDSGRSRDWLEQMMSHEGPDPISKESLDRWFASGRTNAADLLAARQAGGGIEFLELALKQFPDDPRVLMAATLLNKDPTVYRERLERFKSADPNNALADYLSAGNEFRAGNRQKALENLISATGKSGFNDYVLEAARTAEELYLHDGRSPAEAKALGSSTIQLPHLSQLKKLSQEMATLQSEFLAAGDTAAAEQITHMGIRLGEQFSEGPGSMTLIGELVGLAIEKVILKNLRPEDSYDFLNGTAQDYLTRIEERRSSSRPDSAQFESWIRHAPEADILGYFDRLHAHGERAALNWMRQRMAEPTP